MHYNRMRACVVTSTLVSTLFTLLVFEMKAQPDRTNKDYALFFAVEDYQDGAWSDLRNPISDAKAISKELEDTYGFNTEIIENPPKERIFTVLNSYLSKSYAEDAQLLVFISGHGIFNEKTSEGFFIPSDGRGDDIIQSSYLPHTRLERIISNIPCPHILLVIDACFSGTFDEDIALNRGGPGFRRPGDTPDKQRLDFIEDKLKYKSRLYLTSGGKERTSDGIQYSPLTEHFLEGLRSFGGEDQLLTFAELIPFMENTDPMPKWGQFTGHEPGGSFLFIRPLHFTSNNKSYELFARDRQGWEAAKAKNTISAYEGYLDQFPQGMFRHQAIAKKQMLQKEEQLWYIACEKNSLQDFENYIVRFPNGKYIDEARRKRDHIAVPRSGPKKGPIQVNTSTLQGGSFQMGGHYHLISDKYTHTVKLSSYEIGQYEVTFEEYDLFCKATKRRLPDDEGWGRGKQPVINVSWFDAVEYCNWLSKQRGLEKVYVISGSRVEVNFNANGYRLPTEAEWEYAASYRTGATKALFGNGKDIADPREINFDGSQLNKKDYSIEGVSRGRPIQVGQLNSTNALKLHDMSGNVREWCQDWYEDDYYEISPTKDPPGPSTGRKRVIRGGDYSDGPEYILITQRTGLPPQSRSKTIGFRVSRSL